MHIAFCEYFIEFHKKLHTSKKSVKWFDDFSDGNSIGGLKVGSIFISKNKIKNNAGKCECSQASSFY